MQPQHSRPTPATLAARRTAKAAAAIEAARERAEAPDRAAINLQLRSAGYTWSQIADEYIRHRPGLNRLKAYRWAHDLTEQALADIINNDDKGIGTLEPQRVADHERGRRRPSLGYLEDLAKAFATTATDLLTPEQLAKYTPGARALINRIDYRHLDTNHQPNTEPEPEPEPEPAEPSTTPTAGRTTKRKLPKQPPPPEPTKAEPTRAERAERAARLRAKGCTWSAIAAFYLEHYPGINPRRAYRFALNLTHDAIAKLINGLNPGEPTLTKGRVCAFETDPGKDSRRNPTVPYLQNLAKVFQTTGIELLTEEELARYKPHEQEEIRQIDYRHLDENYHPRPAEHPPTTSPQAINNQATPPNAIPHAQDSRPSPTTTAPGPDRPRNVLSQLIHQRHISQQEAATQLGISLRQLGRLTRLMTPADAQNIRPFTRRALQTMFSLPIHELFQPWPDESPQLTPPLQASLLPSADAEPSPHERIIDTVHAPTNDPDAPANHATPTAFGQALQTLRLSANLSLRALAARTYYSPAAIGHLETGQRPPTRESAEALDNALNAHGHLLELAIAQRIDDAAARRAEASASSMPSTRPPRTVTIDTYPLPNPINPYTPPLDTPPTESDTERMLRRTIITTLLALGAHAILPTAPEPTPERFEHAFGTADDWHETTWEYGFAYLSQPRPSFVLDLAPDLAAISHQVYAAKDDQQAMQLAGAAAQLAALLAMASTDLGYQREARHAWKTARRLADRSTVRDHRLWIRGQEAISSIYLERPLQIVHGLVDQGLQIPGRKPLPGEAILHAANAQVLALEGRESEAIAALERVHRTFDKLPDDLSTYSGSILGWSEGRLQHTESFVRALAGPASAAHAAHDRAFSMTDATRPISQCQIQLHRALRLIRDEDPIGGVKQANQALNGLPSSGRGRYVLSLAKAVLNAVPASESTTAAVSEFRYQLTSPTISS